MEASSKPKRTTTVHLTEEALEMLDELLLYLTGEDLKKIKNLRRGLLPRTGVSRSDLVEYCIRFTFEQKRGGKHY
jgi:hypothetical protein